MSQPGESVKTYSYYPGCTLKTKAKRLDRFARLAAKHLGIELVEQKDWQCCGAVYPMGTDDLAARLAAVRSLAQAKDAGHKLVTLCSACHHVIKRINHDMRTDKEMNRKINNFLALPAPYNGETEVIHYLELLRDEIGFENLAKQVVKPLSGQKIGAYYGCMLLRPSKVMQFDDAENPVVLENFLTALGGESVKYSQRNECCGGYLALTSKDDAQGMVKDVISSAKEKGAELLTTACPLCNYNLENNCASETPLPVYYFTELLAQALGIDETPGEENSL